jgi:hypothetical protein
MMGVFCYTLGDLAGGVMWFEPGISEFDGSPVTDGYGCGDRPGSRGASQSGKRHPDFIIRDERPTKPRRKSYLIGEVKLGFGTFYRSWKGKQRGQWRAIQKYSHKHTFFPHVVLALALYQGKAYERRWLEREIRQERLAGLMISIQ